MLKALIVDDEYNNRENLKFLLHNDCREIEVIGMAENGKLARQWLATNTVDIVFLDISMPVETGFEMLQNIPEQNFKVIFVTAHDEFALQAIKASAVDYLLKPVNISELQQAVQKLHQTHFNKQEQLQNNQLVDSLINNYVPGKAPAKIALPQIGSVSFIDTNEIVCLQADSNYTIIYKRDMHKLVVTKTLKDFEEILDENLFLRIHKSHMINLKYIVEYTTTDGGTVKMEDGSTWTISRRQIETFNEKMKNNHALFFK